MSTNGNGWKPRTTETVECPSGQKVQVRRPGPEFTLRAGRIPNFLTATEDPDRKKQEGESDEDFNKRVVTEMSDSQQDTLVAFARQLIVAIVVSPKLVLNPRAELGEMGPDDTGSDFWFLYGYGIKNFYDEKIPIADDGAEVEVKDLETFREESGVSGDSVDSLHVSPPPERDIADPQLMGSAGA